MNELTIGDKIYISSKRAAEITGYAKDYVGQLCREGHVEAKMVGRSWYVLESSIREHRFGAPKEATGRTREDVGAETAEEVEKSHDSFLTWERPTYSPEVPPTMPRVESRKESPKNMAPVADSTISDMQAAWKEWFENKRVPESAPEESTDQDIFGPESREEPQEEAAPIRVHRVHEPEPSHPVAVLSEQMYVDIRPIRPVEASEFPRVPTSASVTRTPRKRARKGTNLIATSLLIAVAFVTIAVGAVGTGVAEKYFGDNAFVQFIGGTSSIQK